MSASILRDLSTKRFWKKVVLRFFAILGLVATAVQLLDIFWGDVLDKANGWALLAIVLCAGLAAFGSCWPRPVEQHYSVSNTQIRIFEADLFDQDSDLAIGTCDTFDTEVPHIISESSVQGQFLARIYHHDRDALDEHLASALSNVEPRSNAVKPGKVLRYNIGTVAPLRHGRRHFYLVAYTTMDEHNQAAGTVDGLWRSLDNLWAEVRRNSNGSPIAVPVLGGGQARMSHLLPAQDSIRLIALSFMLASRHQRVCDRLDIVIRPGEMRKLDMLELQAFLSSLRPS